MYTHDSIGLGEDGPTHQPIEHLTSLRAIPNMTLWRPCDAVETAIAWTAAHRASRAHRARADPPGTAAADAHARSRWPTSARGGYILVDCEGAPECLVIATGSEVAIAAEAVKGCERSGRARPPGLHALH